MSNFSHVARIASIICLSTFVIAICSNAAVSAATFTVDSTLTATDTDAVLDGTCATAGGVCTLKAAIQEANSVVGTDTITLPSGTFNYSVSYDGSNFLPSITESVTITGNGVDSTIIARDIAGAASRFFNIATPNVTFSISNVTLQNGYMNTNGGALIVAANGGTTTLNIVNTKWLNNTLNIAGINRGSAIFLSGTTTGYITIDDSVFYGGISGRGGAINIALTTPNPGGGYLHMSDSRFENNNASATLGNDAALSIRSVPGFSVTIDNTDFINNHSLYGSAFNSWIPLALLSITNSRFTNNTNFTGGCCGTAITLFGSASASTTSSISNNTFTGGNDTYIWFNWLIGPASIFNNTFSGNTGGGAIGLNGSGSSLPNVGAQIYGNTIYGNLYGISLTSRANIYNNTIYDNTQYALNITAPSEKTTVSQNSFYNNGFGIDINPLTYNANDAGDVDSGINDLMNYPLIKKAGFTYEGKLIVKTDLDFNLSEAPFTLEFFDNDSINSSGYGEGKRYIGSVTTSLTGNDVVLTVPITGSTPSSISNITSTGTNANNSTSEFSAVSVDTATYDEIFSGSITINDGSVETNQFSCTLDISATAEFASPVQMIISTNSNFTGAVYESFSSSKEIELTGNDGTKTVYLKFKDPDGNESQIYNDTILLDTTAPTGTISIESGGVYTNTELVSLEFTNEDESAVNMMLSESASFESASWLPYSDTYSYTLGNSDGNKTVYAKFRDSAGNISAHISDSIILDSKNPAVVIRNIGLLDSIPNKSPLFFYFTSQSPRIKGTTGENALVHFVYEQHDYQTSAGADGKFEITIPELPRGYVEMTYYGVDLAGNESQIKVLRLMIGIENFPQEYLNEGNISEEITVTPSPITSGLPTPTMEPSLGVIRIVGYEVKDQSGVLLFNTTVYIDGQQYVTDAKGKIYVEKAPTAEMEIYLVINGEKVEASILGERIVEKGAVMTKSNKVTGMYLLLLIPVGVVGVWFVITRITLRR